jgi:hypothetical protein
MVWRYGGGGEKEKWRGTTPKGKKSKENKEFMNGLASPNVLVQTENKTCRLLFNSFLRPSAIQSTLSVSHKFTLTPPPNYIFHKCTAS